MPYMSHICPIVLVKKSKIVVSQSIHIQWFFRDQGVEDAGAADPDSAAGHVDFALEQQNGGKSKKWWKMMEKYVDVPWCS